MISRRGLQEKKKTLLAPQALCKEAMRQRSPSVRHTGTFAPDIAQCSPKCEARARPSASGQAGVRGGPSKPHPMRDTSVSANEGPDHRQAPEASVTAHGE